MSIKNKVQIHPSTLILKIKISSGGRLGTCEAETGLRRFFSLNNNLDLGEIIVFSLK